MKTSQPATIYADHEVEYVTNTSQTLRTTIGHAESAEAACKRLLDIYSQPAGYRDWFAVSAKSIRVIREYCPNDVQIAQLSTDWDQVTGRYNVTDCKGREAYSEHGGGHIRTALDFLLSVNPEAQWKTVGLLTTLRQAFREDSANCRTEEMDMLLERGPTKNAVRLYLAGARCRDLAHHGQHTF